MSLNEISAFLKSHDNYEILTHAYPDGDTLGSGYALCRALQKLGKKARVITTNIPSKFLYLLNGVKEQYFACQKIISVDVAAESLLAGGLAIYGGGLSGLDLFELRNLPGGHPDGCHCSHGAGDCYLGNVGGKTAAATFFVVLEWNWQGYQGYFSSTGKNFSNNS